MFFNLAVNAIPEEAPIAKQVTQLEERSSLHPKKLHTAAVIAVVDKAKVYCPFLIFDRHGAVGNPSPTG